MTRRRAAAINLLFNYGGTFVAIAKGILFVPMYLRHFSLSAYEHGWRRRTSLACWAWSMSD